MCEEMAESKTARETARERSHQEITGRQEKKWNLPNIVLFDTFSKGIPLASASWTYLGPTTEAPVVMKLRDANDDPDILRQTVSSIHRRVLNDQFRQDYLYASLGGRAHYDDYQQTELVDPIASKTTNVIAKLKTFGVSAREDVLLRECSQLLQETDSYLDAMNAGTGSFCVPRRLIPNPNLVPVVFTNESKDVDQLLSQIRFPARLIAQVKREHTTALKLKRNWWDLVPLYCDETLSNLGHHWNYTRSSR
jgi:hypothetical protein